MASTDTTPVTGAVDDRTGGRRALFRDHLMTVVYLTLVGLGSGVVIGLIDDTAMTMGVINGTGAGIVFGIVYLVVLLLSSL